MKLLERDHILERLELQLAESRAGRGSMVLVSGEAGIGKTAVVEVFCDGHRGDAHVLWGSCDPVVPARPLAPVLDIAHAIGGPLREALDRGSREGVLDAFLRLLSDPGSAPLVIVLEDLHWADDATFDLVRVVGRRVRTLPVLVVGTYRDHQVGGEHPLRVALGDVPADVVAELKVPPLSADAVAALAEGNGLDAVAVLRVTNGNPFFVAELLAAPSDELPVAVADAVVARVSRLSPEAQHLLRAASVSGPRFAQDVALDVADRDSDALAECVAAGMLVVEGDVACFRHELAQRAVYDRLASRERIALHRRTLEALRSGSVAEPAELAHHAAGARDSESVLELAQSAAERAAGLGAHREAVAHYALALEFAGSLDGRSRAALLEGHARESLAIDDVDGAVRSQRLAVDCWKRLGDERGEALCLRSLSLMVWFAGDARTAVEIAQRAVDLLERATPEGVELAGAYATLAQRLLAGGGDDARAREMAERALALAGRLHDERVVVHSLTTIGVAEVMLGGEDGWASLDEAHRRAARAGLKEDASRALINLVEAARDRRRYERADPYRDLAISYIDEHDPDHDLFRRRLIGVLAEIALDRGRWDEAAELVDGLIRERSSAPITRARALTVLGRLHARRGDGSPWPALDEARSLVDGRGDAQDLCPLTAARAEAAWLEGDMLQSRAEVDASLAMSSIDPWWQSELGFWAWKSGSRSRLTAPSVEPYALHVAGRHAQAASAWRTIGCPYHEALALSDSGDERDLRRALAIFQGLGAAPMSGVVTRRLRALGARGVPRGPRRRTRANPAGFTPRELEVLELLASGLTNAVIAERLVLSVKTVDHHVSAILRKLDVRTRTEAAKEAARLGVQDGELSSAR